MPDTRSIDLDILEFSHVLQEMNGLIPGIGKVEDITIPNFALLKELGNANGLTGLVFAST